MGTFLRSWERLMKSREQASESPFLGFVWAKPGEQLDKEVSFWMVNSIDWNQPFHNRSGFKWSIRQSRINKITRQLKRKQDHRGHWRSFNLACLFVQYIYNNYKIEWCEHAQRIFEADSVDWIKELAEESPYITAEGCLNNIQGGMLSIILPNIRDGTLTAEHVAGYFNPLNVVSSAGNNYAPMIVEGPRTRAAIEKQIEQQFNTTFVKYHRTELYWRSLEFLGKIKPEENARTQFFGYQELKYGACQYLDWYEHLCASSKASMDE